MSANEPHREPFLPMKLISRFVRMAFFDEWTGSWDGRPVMWTKHLFAAFGWKVSVHKFVRGDDVGCFHTHPASALRVILSGGYTEELADGSCRELKPWHVDIVRPELEHRVCCLLDGRSSWSLWIRGPKIADINIRGCA